MYKIFLMMFLLLGISACTNVDMNPYANGSGPAKAPTVWR